MEVTLIFDSQFGGQASKTICVSNGTSPEQIEDMFETELGVKYDSNCYYEIN